MGANSFGRFFTVTTFGESRSLGVGAVIDGCPAGVPLKNEDIQSALNRRKPSPLLRGGKEVKTAHIFSTTRAEEDLCEILSGVYLEKTLGSPIAVLVKNKETSFKNYENLKDIYRPGHADYAYEIKYGFRDYRGGGRASGRETVGRVIGGACARAFLNSYFEKTGQKKTEIKIWAEEIAGIKTSPVFENSALPENISEKLLQLSREGDSAGCVLSAEVLNVPKGLGSPVFYKLDAVLSQALMSIGAVKGIEIGGGFASASLTASENNKIGKNYSGGISGGISEDNIFFRLSVKAPPSIRKEQTAFNSEGEKIKLSVTGEHDVCLFPRIVPVVEAMVYLTLADSVLASVNDRV
ncbi:chorismate synthase [Treponema pedis]|uniref:chorismate synthase n=1 Tax=Treponema pedis TaxID=409322 RepID=UPI0003F576AB|nr:chorismate synthase [Treponema pedis]